MKKKEDKIALSRLVSGHQSTTPALSIQQSLSGAGHCLLLCFHIKPGVHSSFAFIRFTAPKGDIPAKHFAGHPELDATLNVVWSSGDGSAYSRTWNSLPLCLTLNLVSEK